MALSGFRPYALRALVFALAASALSILFGDVLAFLLAHEAMGFIPKYLALLLGSVHSPSYLGLFIGLFLEWAVLALLGAWAL